MKLFERKIPVIRVGAMTSTGCVREENQDNMSRFYSPLGEVFVVADGMGGHKGGAAAAEMVTHGLEEELSTVGGNIPVPVALRAATQAVNEAIHREAKSGNPETEGMGSTVVLALVTGGNLFVGHVGDSRAYLFRKGKLQRLTRDHSRIQKMIDGGLMTEAEGREHPDASVLNRNMGGSPKVEMEVSAPIPIQEGDVFVLCTDGLCGYIQDDAIGRIIAPLSEAQATAEALVDISLKAGGEDNVTVQVIQCGPRKGCAYVPMPPTPPRASPVTGKPKSSRWPLLVSVGVLLLVVLVLGVVLGIYAPWHKDRLPGAPKADKPGASRPASLKADAAEPKTGRQVEDGQSQTDLKDTKDQSGAQHVLVLGSQSREQQEKVTRIVKATLKSCIIQVIEDESYEGEAPVVWFFGKGKAASLALELRKKLEYPDKQAKPMPNPVHEKYSAFTFIIVPGQRPPNLGTKWAPAPNPVPEKKAKP